MGYIFEHYSLVSWEPLLTTLYLQRVVLLSAGAMAKSTKLEEENFLKAKQ
jgi:hypothetical protein